MPNIGTPELLIILLVVVLIFGSAKLPQLARSLGKSARILKAETKGLRDDDEQPEGKSAPAEDTAAQDAARDRAAQLRAEAARLEREAAAGDAAPRSQGALPPAEPIQGVPVDPSRTRHS
ncbi:Sec-independent protein translocase subunit TatA [Actinomadura fulvescens]|uniref:Sec-independent protein translocase protein TatA n=1 Tax=Actinomadura fulvescens TaxID=46160 RepID=A0ABN3PMN0_9ACTN